MKRIFTRLSVILASAGLTLLGFGSCNTTKKAQQEVSQADKVEAERIEQEQARLRQTMKDDSVRNAYEDSMRMVRMGQRKLVYGGPNMMGRRVIKDTIHVEKKK